MEVISHFVHHVIICISILCNITIVASVAVGGHRFVPLPKNDLFINGSKMFLKLSDNQPSISRKESPVKLTKSGPNGKQICFDVGITVTTNLYRNSFAHLLTVTNATVKFWFEKANITSKFLQLGKVYGVSTDTLDHEDVQNYMNVLSIENHCSLQLDIFYETDIGLHILETTSTVLMAPHGIRVLKMFSVVKSKRLVIRTKELENGLQYKDVPCVIESEAYANRYLVALPNGHLSLGPLNNTARALFVMRQYIGFTSAVKQEYKVFQDGSMVHVHLFQMNEHLPQFQYISRGFQENVFINTRKKAIDNFALNEADPRFFYERRLPGTDLSVFMSTSLPNHYLAVHGMTKVVYLQDVLNAEDFMNGYNNAKFKVYQEQKN